MFSNLLISTRLRGIGAIGIIATCLTAAAGSYGLLRSNTGLEAAITATSAVFHQKQADMMHDALRADVLNALVTGPGAQASDRAGILADLTEHTESFTLSIATLQSLPLPDAVRADVDKVVPALKVYIASAAAIIRQSLSDHDAGLAMLAQFSADFTTLETELAVLGEAIAAQSVASGREARAENTLLIKVLIGAAVVVSAVMFAVATLIARSVTRPLLRVKAAIGDVAQGLLDLPVADADRRDELGEIAQALNVLRSKLLTARDMENDRQESTQRQVVGELSIGLRNLANGILTRPIEVEFGADYETLRHDYNQTLDRLHQTITQVIMAAQQIRGRSVEISQAADDLSKRTENQAATLEETAAALDQLTASVKAAADGAREVERIVRSARSEAEESGSVVRGAVEAMTGIEKSSGQISTIIGVIDDIAFQTNLLALNAGVEAARAGDAGRGFAVVASEVRALAQRSSDASREIKMLISTSAQLVTTGVDAVGQAGKALASIVTRVAHISTLVSDIAAAAAQQSSGLAEVNIGVTQLDQVAQNNAAMVEESATASRALQQEAQRLDQLVSHFAVGTETGMANQPVPETRRRTAA